MKKTRTEILAGVVLLAFAVSFAGANNPPVADPDGPYFEILGSAITFDGSGSSDPDGGILTYEWEFGDGVTGTGVSPTHTYATATTVYSVTLTVTDEGGLTDSADTTVVFTQISVVASASITSGPAPLLVNFSATTEGGSIDLYEWDFEGDGTFDFSSTSTADTSYTYTSVGTYNATIRVTDIFLGAGSVTVTDTIIITVLPTTTTVNIDIKPGSNPNSINQGSNGVIPVAILSSDTFDATTVDPATVELGGASVAVRGKADKSLAHLEDVNGDGLVDLVVQVETQGLDDLGAGGTVELTGTTFSGEDIVGYDDVVIVPPE